MGFKKKEKLVDIEDLIPTDAPIEEQKKGEKKEVKRIIPIDQNNEQFLLGHALNDKLLLERLLSEAQHDTFLYVNHKVLVECMSYLHTRNLDVTLDSIETVKKKFDRGLSVKLKYLGELKATFNENVTEENYKFHIAKLKDDKVKDTLTMLSLPELGKMLINPKVGVDEIIQELSKLMDNIEDSYVDGDFKFVDMREVNEKHTEELKKREEGTVFGTTGYEKLDKLLTDGFSRKKLSIIAGRTGMGKSALLANIFLRLGLLGIPVGCFNFEMDDISMYDRMVAIKANIPLLKIIKERELLTKDEQIRENEAKEEISKLPIYFYTASTQTLEGIKRDLRLLRDRYNVHLIGYDLFDKIKFRFGGGRSTADVLNDALKQIQGFGRDLDIHQILIVQIGRSAEKRKNKRPKLSELKDAGGYEERSDNIFFLYRPSYYQNAEDDKEIEINTMDELEIIVAKQRQGIANVKATFDFFPASTTIAEPMLTDGMPEQEETDGTTDKE